ncbi:hypothetical protein LWI28_009416 [Acer negundo]|uniref:Uncharacterized protein n=1 Tax=Acer negundo TaxID=4023 RepID=A0AAD5P522_ACENE|nr:hypothetical protein LWI28_009416 [Acer negundo]
MANSRIARFVMEVAPPQFVSVMRHRTAKMLDTISEEEKDVVGASSDSLASSSKCFSTACASVSSAASKSASSSVTAADSNKEWSHRHQRLSVGLGRAKIFGCGVAVETTDRTNGGAGMIRITENNMEYGYEYDHTKQLLEFGLSQFRIGEVRSSPKFPGKVNNDGNKVLGKGKGCWTQKSRPKPRQPICNSAVKIGKYVGLVSKATTDTSSCEEDFRGGANLYVNKFKGECSRVENRLVDYLENGFQDIRLVRNKKSTYHKVRMDGGANDQTKGEPNEGSPNKMGFQGESQSSLEEGEAHSPIHHYDVVIKNQSNGQKVLYKQVEKDKSLDLFVDLRS